MLTAVDGQVSGGGGFDRFRINIWWEHEDGTQNIVYDNQLGADDDAEPTTALGGGSITIHEPNRQSELSGRSLSPGASRRK